METWIGWPFGASGDSPVCIFLIFVPPNRPLWQIFGTNIIENDFWTMETWMGWSLEGASLKVTGQKPLHSSARGPAGNLQFASFYHLYHELATFGETQCGLVQSACKLTFGPEWAGPWTGHPGRSPGRTSRRGQAGIRPCVSFYHLYPKSATLTDLWPICGTIHWIY